jgi:hypothetical protein
MAKTPTGKGNAQARDSTVGADYLNTRQLFSQDDLQTQDLNDAEGLAEEQRIQRAFFHATEQHKNRRVTFTEVATDDEDITTPNEGDEMQADDDLGTSLTIKDILTNLDESADQFAKEVQARPNYVYNLIGKLCNSLRLLQEHNDLLHQSNSRNVKMRERLASQHQDVQERLQQATEKITELAQEQDDPQQKSRATAQLSKMKEKNQWYADGMKEKDAVVNKLNNELAQLMTDNDELSTKCDRLKDDITQHAANEQARGRTSSHRRDPSTSLSPYSRAHAIGLPPLPDRRNARRTDRSESCAGSEAARRVRRENTAATSNASRASVNLDPESSKAIVVDRSVKDPDNFKGDQNTFYPWLTAMVLKLSTAVFRTEADGLRYVQGFLGGAPWALIAPRVPTLGGWGKPCPNPFPDVDSMMKLLAERYGEDNTEERAMTAMVSLKQADKQDFNIFYAKYQEYQAYCPMATDKQEIHRLQGKLNSRFRDKLIDGTECASLKELVSRCARLQTQWESMDPPRSESKGRRKRKDKDDNSAPAAGARKSYTKVDMPASELPREYRNMPPLTNDLRQSLRDSGGCYKCRKPGHTGNQRDKCPLAILEDAYAVKHPKVNQVEVDTAAEELPSSGNGTATR